MKKSAKKDCVECGHAVGGGGNRHKRDHCPPRPGVYGDSRRLKLQQKKSKKKAEKNPQRGITVAGTGVKADQPET